MGGWALPNIGLFVHKNYMSTCCCTAVDGDIRAGEGLHLPCGQSSLAEVKEGVRRNHRQKVGRGMCSLGMDDGSRYPVSENDLISNRTPQYP